MFVSHYVRVTRLALRASNSRLSLRSSYSS
jgi:hypothetical protein